MTSIAEVQATADAALLAVRAANEKADAIIATLVDVRNQLAVGMPAPAALDNIVATLNQAITEASDQVAQDDAALSP